MGRPELILTRPELEAKRRRLRDMIRVSEHLRLGQGRINFIRDELETVEWLLGES